MRLENFTLKGALAFVLIVISFVLVYTWMMHPPATADSMSRRSGRFSSQNTDSADSLSKIGTSSQLAKVCNTNLKF